MKTTVAFDCFGTVFDMKGISRKEISAYVDHVKKNDFTPFSFPESWWNLPLHKDSAEGIRILQNKGYQCVALSNGSIGLLRKVSETGGIFWNHIVDLLLHKVYKPHKDAYLTIKKDLGVLPQETYMVTANPTFGDVEGASSVGMTPLIIRQPKHPQTIIDLANSL